MRRPRVGRVSVQICAVAVVYLLRFIRCEAVVLQDEVAVVVFLVAVALCDAVAARKRKKINILIDEVILKQKLFFPHRDDIYLAVIGLL